MICEYSGDHDLLLRRAGGESTKGLAFGLDLEYSLKLELIKENASLKPIHQTD